MKAKLKPLNGKYYGTEIEIEFEDGSDNEVIKFWNTDGFEPSIRELESNGITQKQWDNNELIDNGWDGKSKAKEMDIICDSHFESKLTYERALAVVSALNGC